MTRKMKIVTALSAGFLLLAGAAGIAIAQSATLVSAALADGTVGEQADGFLGFRVASTDAPLTAAVQVTNAARREGYARSAQSAGGDATAEAAGLRAFQTIVMARIQTGQWYRNAEGEWVQR